MSRDANPALSLRHTLPAVCRAWRPLLVYKLLMSLLGTLVLGPLLLAYSYKLIGISDEAVWGNWELAGFLVSPQGIAALVVGLSIALGLVFLEYSGLVLLADTALRGSALSIRQFVTALVAAALRLFVLAFICTALALLVVALFAGLAALAYWLLLSGTDINFYLTERPPRFWAAMVVAAVLAIALAAALLCLFARWAFVVPACVLERQSLLSSLRSSSRLIRGRLVRLLMVLGIWQAIHSVAVIGALFGLDYLHAGLSGRFEELLTFLVWTTAALLLFDLLVLQLLAAVFAIGTAVLLAREYELALQAHPEGAADRPHQGAAIPAAQASRGARAAILAALILGPLVSLGSAALLARSFVEHRPARVTAHRGGPKAAPENSLAALRLALAARADFVEIDVQLTSDGTVVLLHDRDLRRVTGDPRELGQLSLADVQELRLRLGRETTAERVPTLAEFIAACDDKVRLNIELKETSRHPQLVPAVMQVLRDKDFANRVIVSCFDLPPLERVRAAEPDIPIGLILSAVRGDITRLPVNFFSLHQRLVRADVVRRAHERSMEVHAWTVNDRESALRLLDLGVDNLITSDPALMREVVDWYAGLGDVERLLLRLRRWVRE